MAAQLRWRTSTDPLFREFSQSLAVFKPQVLQTLLVVTSAPVAAALEVLWRRHRNVPHRPLENAPSGTELQLASLFERTLLYGVSGQQSVLSPRIGNALGLTPGITHHGGLPCFTSTLALWGPAAPYVDPNHWPLFNGSPVMITGPTIKHHFGQQNEAVSPSHRFFPCRIACTICRNAKRELRRLTPVICIVYDFGSSPTADLHPEIRCSPSFTFLHPTKSRLLTYWPVSLRMVSPRPRNLPAQQGVPTLPRVYCGENRGALPGRAGRGPSAIRLLLSSPDSPRSPCNRSRGREGDPSDSLQHFGAVVSTRNAVCQWQPPRGDRSVSQPDRNGDG